MANNKYVGWTILLASVYRKTQLVLA